MWIEGEVHMFVCGLSAAQVSVIVFVLHASFLTADSKNNTKPIIMVQT